MVLSETWFMEGYIDFELQKYRLLAYLKDVRNSFNAKRLYPQLSDIVAHYKNLVAFRDNKKLLQKQFHKRLDQLDARKMELVYEKILSDDDVMQELEQITTYALDQMKSTINEGAGLFEFVEKTLEVEPIGIIPLYKNEGFVFLRYGSLSEVLIYCYTITLFEHKNARYKGIRLEHIDSRDKTLANTYQQIKLDIIRSYRTLPNPAVYKVEFPHALPLEETLLPIAKRVLMKFIEVEAR
ncbi:MAG: hypothetical protein H7257_03565 [Taibaiella sp.]|nr:hypothetical protein [Taibaiella sp.]